MNINIKNRKKLKNNFRDRKKMFGGWVSFSHPSIIEILSYTGFDFLAIDMEHSPISLADSQQIIQISQSFNIPCLPRPVSHSNDWIKPILDFGADGLFITTLENIDQLKNLEQLLKYPPIGKRSYGINRAQVYGFESEQYFKSWNDSSIMVGQIENIKGVENLESILKMKILDAIMIGPYDLAGSMGYPGQVDHKNVKTECKKIIKICEKYKISVGTQVSEVSSKKVKELYEMNYTYTILGSDLFLLWKSAASIKSIIDNFR
tara:strand:+ start:1987 stop:2772 length:786 start_codon:yes stop_codon:yes gene_type:complete